MDPGCCPETHGDCSPDDHDVTSWVCVCASGLWKVQRRQTHKNGGQAALNPGDDGSLTSIDRPRTGSLCRVRVCLKEDIGETDGPGSCEGDEMPPIPSDQPVAEPIEMTATPVPRSQSSALHVLLGDWTTLRLGEGQCDVTESCLEGMRAGERWEILLTPLGNGPEGPVDQLAEGNQPLCATVELHSFTSVDESWEMPPAEKWDWVRSHKERGGARFRGGDVWGAADSYSRALKLLITLYRHTSETKQADAIPEEEEEEEEEEQKETSTGEETSKLPPNPQVPSMNVYQTTKAELHSNLSLCQLKLNQPLRARANAAKATQLEPGGTKAWYRLGQACQNLDELDDAKRAFRRLLELQPDSPAAQKALKDVSSKEKERNTREKEMLGQRLSKMFG